MLIERSDMADAEDILNLQKTAYLSEAEIYNDHSIPPLVQSPEEIKLDFKDYVFFKAVMEGQIVGSVRANMKEGTCLIGRLMVHPDFQNRGIGTMLLNRIKRHFKDAERFELFMGHRSERNLHIYGKSGYQIFKSVTISGKLKLLDLKKSARPER